MMGDMDSGMMDEAEADPTMEHDHGDDSDEA
jgi:hypothetical protein